MGKTEEAMNKSLIIILFCSTVNISNKVCRIKKRRRRNKLSNVCFSLRIFQKSIPKNLIKLKTIIITRNF